MTLKITISGVRGVYGEELTDDIAEKFAIAFGRFLGKGKDQKVVIGYDTRNSTPALREAVYKGLNSENIEIIDAGVVPTPVVQVITRMLKADGGVIITASHNPQQYNGLKFVRADGIFLNQQEASYLISLYEKIADEQLSKLASARDIDFQPELRQQYLKHLYQSFDMKNLKDSGLKLVVDAANGAGTIIDQEMLDELGLKYKIINEIPKGDFNRSPEPTPENIKELSKAVVEFGADLGFAQDADADRLAIVDEKGQPIGEDNTLVLTADYILRTATDPRYKIVVTNLSTTRLIDHVAAKHGARVIRTKIGEVNVSEAIKKHSAPIGGEGNGGVIMPSVGFGRDSLAGILAILSLLSREKKKLSEIVATYPQYFMVKDKIPFNSDSQLEIYLDKTRELYKNEVIDETDGIKITFQDGNWIHIRSSNTEPIIRIIAEADSHERSLELIKSLKQQLMDI